MSDIAAIVSWARGRVSAMREMHQMVTPDAVGATVEPVLAEVEALIARSSPFGAQDATVLGTLAQERVRRRKAEIQAAALQHQLERLRNISRAERERLGALLSMEETRAREFGECNRNHLVERRRLEQALETANRALDNIRREVPPDNAVVSIEGALRHLYQIEVHLRTTGRQSL